ncbi:MAG: tartrate dehydrogenase [Acidimicrobiaceae bacterium]|nr:tartrate dehydrogenase [Acidimicrobiaceae bacterium]
MTSQTSGGAPSRIAVIAGDGIGVEVTEQSVRVLERLVPGRLTFDWFDWGCHYYTRTGRMMPAEGLDTLRQYVAILFGAVGWPGVPDHVSLWGLRLAICQGFDLYANVRPVHFFEGVEGPLRRTDQDRLGWVVVRENTEGEYAGVGGRQFDSRGDGKAVAVQSAMFTEEGCERIMRFAFDLARTRAHKVTSITKSNAQQYGMVLWDDVFASVQRDYPDVACDSCLVDAMAARMVLHPESVDVAVGSNLNGDILSDLGSALAGSLGLAASANLDPLRRNPSMFEPVHGSAPDIAGKGIANPVGAIASAAMMLDHLGMAADAAELMAAIRATLAQGVKTPDIGGRAMTRDIADAVIHHLRLPELT